MCSANKISWLMARLDGYVTVGKGQEDSDDSLKIFCKSPTFIQDLLSKCSLGLHILDISWAYLGHTLGIPWAYLGHSLGIPWAYLGHISGISLAYLGHSLGIPWAYLGHILGWLSRLVVKTTSVSPDCCQHFQQCQYCQHYLQNFEIFGFLRSRIFLRSQHILRSESFLRSKSILRS